MSNTLTHNAYGKSNIRLTRVTRHPDRHDLKELCIAIQLEGDFADSYLTGDNSKVVATDTMKNTVYTLAKKHDVSTIESFGEILAKHFLETYPHITSATIELVEQPWQRMVIDGKTHPHTFIGGGSEKRTATVKLTRDYLGIESGLDDLPLLKTTDSAFSGFIQDEYTTLRDTDDRIFATLLSARWLYNPFPTDWDESYHSIRQMLLKMFAGHKSLAVQHTLHAMAEAALATCSAIEQITLQMPNRHHLLANLEPFKLDNKNEVFIATQEPFGLISGTWRR